MMPNNDIWSLNPSLWHKYTAQVVIQSKLEFILFYSYNAAVLYSANPEYLIQLVCSAYPDIYI